MDVFAVAFPDDALKGRVTSIATSAKSASSRDGLSFTVKILLENDESIDVRPGMSCRAEIFTKVRGDTIAIPMQSVVYDEVEADESEVRVRGGSRGVRFGARDNLKMTSHVFVVVDGIASKREVKLGISNDELQGITEGIDEGDVVVIGPARLLNKLNDGDTVSIRKGKTS